MITGLNWLGYKVEKVSVIDAERGTRGRVNSKTRTVKLLNNAAYNVAVHENIHVWQHEKFPEEKYGEYWRLSNKMPYTIRPHEICARMVQHGNKTLEESLRDFQWFVKDTQKRLAFLWQRQVKRAVQAAFTEASGEEIKELTIRENGVEVKTAVRTILVMLCHRDNMDAYVSDTEVSRQAFNRGTLYMRTTSNFRGNVEGFLASIPGRLQ